MSAILTRAWTDKPGYSRLLCKLSSPLGTVARQNVILILRGRIRTQIPIQPPAALSEIPTRLMVASAAQKRRSCERRCLARNIIASMNLKYAYLFTILTSLSLSSPIAHLKANCVDLYRKMIPSGVFGTCLALRTSSAISSMPPRTLRSRGL